MHDHDTATLNDRFEELENYFRNTVIPQVFIDADFRLRKFTPPAMKQFNLSPADIGQNIADIADNFRFPGLKENIVEVIQTQQMLEKEVQTTDMRWYQMNILPYIRRLDGSTNGVIITFIDITARITDLKEQERLIAEHELLLDTISHDIRHSVTSVKIAVISMQSLSEKERREMTPLLEVADRALKRMEAIINELFETRKAAYSALSVEERINIENIMEDVRLSLFEEIKKSKAVIRLEAGISEINFSRRKLRSILHNLVGNAIKYRRYEQTPVIVIETYTEPGFIVMTVTDNGKGIPAGQTARIFEKYERLSDEMEGSGIGLFLVKQILENAGGSIAVESEPGKGTVFTVRIKAL